MSYGSTMTLGERASGAPPAPGRRKSTPAKRTRGQQTGGKQTSAKPARGKPARDSGLRAPWLPRPSWQSKGWRYSLAAGAVTLLVGWMVWYAATPEGLPVSDRVVKASGVVDTPLYVGMFTAPDDFERTLRIAGVKVHATATEKISVTPVLCRRGAIGVTTEPDQFCNDIIDPEGERLVAGDSIVLKIESDVPALAVIDQIRIAYREDLRWDTQDAGNHQAIVTLAGRPE